MRRRAEVGGSRAVAVALAIAVLAGCGSSGPRSGGTGNPLHPSTIAVVTTSTTSTTLAPTADPAFHTRRPGVLTVATDHGQAPWFEIDPDSGMAHDGFEYDVARALASRLGLGGIRLVHGSLDAIEEGYDCLCDVYLGAVSVTEALARKVDLSTPYVAADPAVLVRAGALAPTLATAPALRWALMATDADAVSVVAHDFEPAAAPLRLVSSEAVVHSVAAGDADAALLPAPLALLAAKSDPTLAVVARFDRGATWAAVEPLGSANSPSLSDLLAKLADDGTLAFISRRHLGVDPATLPVVLPE